MASPRLERVSHAQSVVWYFNPSQRHLFTFGAWFALVDRLQAMPFMIGTAWCWPRYLRSALVMPMAARFDDCGH